MSFLSSQRGYDALSPPDLDLPRVSMNTLPPFDSISSSSLQSVLHPSMSHSSPSNPPVADRPQISLPKVGQTRCYWALLSSELNFLYLDPVLANHLKEQADLLLGKSLLTFVHPDEQASAEQDLGGVLESRTLHGSVTRVRYSRLSRVRRQLGYQGPTDEWADAKKIAVDGQYMAVDLVINWAADGLVLCFMHAAVDLSTRDNDPVNKTDWTNWCGTPYMSGDQVDFLHEQLNKRVTVPPTHDRVFQILLDQPERPLWVSWPPDTSDNSGPTAKDFARLAEDIQIGPLSSSGTDAKTNCTRRYKALQTLPFGVNSTREVESIFIPYGSIIFACHRVNTYAKSGVSAIIPQHIHTNNHYPPMNQQYYDHSYSHPSTHHSYNNGYPPPMPHPSAPYSSHNWPPGSEPGPHPQYNNQWVSQNAPISSSPSVSSMRSSSYPPPHQHQWSSQPPYMDSNPQTSYSFPPPNVSYPGSAQVPPSPGPPSPGSDVVPASRIPRRGTGNRDSYTNGGRTSGNPPNGVNRCASCKVTHSPEWRKGPSGKKDLCNACGLRYARSRAKKEGSAQRRRKERVLNTMSSRDDHSPSGSPVSMPYSGMRGRSSTYDDGSFVSNSSAGSASGNEAFPHHHHHGMGMTPSPSPPGNGFIPYSHQSASHNQPHNQYSSHGEHRSHYNNHPAAFYSVPPPPPGHGMHHHMSNSHSSGHSRMDSNVPLGRVSPLVSPSSPVCSSPLSTGLSAASFEREKQRERENERGLLPPTPDSTEHPCSSKLKY